MAAQLQPSSLVFIETPHFFPQDKTSPDHVTKDLNGLPFNAVFAKDHTRGKKLYNRPGMDGFVFDSKPLNSVSESPAVNIEP